MKFRRTFIVNAPLKTVAAFHAQSASMAAITPPPIIAQIKSAPEILREGDTMAFVLWLGFIPIFWKAKIENVSPNGFTDRQLRGPMAHWTHRHTFKRLSPKRTRVIDEIDASLKKDPLGFLIGGMMWLGLPVLFAFRGRKTKKLLSSPTKSKWKK